MPNVTISETTYRRVMGCALGLTGEDTSATHNDDGTVTVPVGEGVHKMLTSGRRTPDQALNRLVSKYGDLS